MITKLQSYSQLAEHTSGQITGSRESWTAFLKTAARLYKYPYPEQLMIYTQRPDAQACAPIEIWNKPMNRWVKRGSKGIALIDTTSDKPKLKYVFDISDTEDGRVNSHRPFLWELKGEHEAPVMEALANSFDSDAQGDLGNVLCEIAGRMASEYYNDNRGDILYSTEGSYLEDLDEFNIEVACREALTVSLAYSLISRCGLDPADYFEDEDFMPVFDFNTSEAAGALGTGVSQLSEQVLREVEITIKKYEREKSNERSFSHEQLDIPPERGLSRSEPAIGRESIIRGTTGQVRPNAADISTESPSNSIQFPRTEREAAPTPARDRQDSEPPFRPDIDRTDTAKPAAGQNLGSVGVDSAYEQLTPTGGGADTARTNLHLTPAPSLDDTALDGLLSHSKLDTSDIDTMLRSAGNGKNSDQRIALQYAHDLSPSEISAFLKEEYRSGGKGVQIGTEEVSAWWDKDGLLVGVGKSALQASDRVFLSWQQVESRIRSLVQTGTYISADRLEPAAETEHRRLAELLIFTYRDDMRDICEMPQEWEENGNGFPNMADKVSSLLAAPETRDKIISTLQRDNETLKEHSHERRWRLHDVDKLLGKLAQWQQPMVGLQQSEMQYAHGFPFITDDEVDAFLCKGSSFSDGKARIIEHFLNEHTLKESANFLKEEYGTGGGSHALSGADDSHESHSAKGLKLERGSMGTPYAIVEMNWSTVAKRIDTLINEGRFFTNADIEDFRERYTKEKIAREIASFYYNVPEDILPDGDTQLYAKIDDFSDRVKTILPRLDNPISLRNIHLSMVHVFHQLEPDARNYTQKQETLETIKAYRDGKLDLIPLLSTVPVPENILSTVGNVPLIKAMPEKEPEQLSFFPTEQKQKEIVAEAEELNSSAFIITENDISATILNWNGDPSSQRRVYDHMVLHPRERSTAAFLQSEFGGDNKGLLITKEGAKSLFLPWAKVQRRIARLIEQNEFLPPVEEQANDISFDSADSIAKIPVSPPPVFFADWNTAKSDFDLSLYNDQDVIGYNKDGVEYTLGRMGETDYITTSTIVAPWGDVLGNSDIPRDIWAQMNAYRNGELTDPQVRENYLYVIASQAPAQEAAKDDISDYLLDYRYVNNRLIVFNNIDFDPDKISPIVARVEPDGSIIYLDENLPGKERLTIEHTAATKLDWYKDEAETNLQNMFDFSRSATDKQPPTASNFHITDDRLGEGGPKTKYSFNIAAIRTLKQIELENRTATPAEQEILSKYVGWGGLPQAFDRENDKWEKEYAELKELLTPDEYEKANASTLNAHYTFPTIIRSIYDTVERLGFQTGNILEPACGTGNFFGLLPESMKNSKLFGVELDSITGQIAKRLYPEADIHISGFEKTDTPDALFDLAIGNVPFGNYPVPDKRYDKHHFVIHDYFFAKSLDQVRPGGIVAFITTSGTLDKKNPSVRKYIAQRAELLGAVRLPNNAFSKNAGTEVTTDIIFLQKRDRLIDIEPDWVHLGETTDGVPLNSYFAEHPEMVLGTMVFDERMYGSQKDTACHPIEGADLAQQLQKAMQNIEGQITEVTLDDISEPADVSIPADPSVRNYSYTVVDDTAYYRENSRMHPVELPVATLERIKGMTELRDCVHTLIDYQLHEYGDDEILAEQARLNTLYDSFTRKHGLLNATANSRAFSSDSAYFLLCSLEILDENGELERKADMFSKRTIKQKAVVTSVDTSSEALAVSIAERAHVDLGFMQSLTGFTEEKLVSDLKGVIFLDFNQTEDSAYTYRTADDFLSGNVREKLQFYKNTLELAANDAPYMEAVKANISALEQAQPQDLTASEISVRLGSTWVSKEYMEQFVHELLDPPYYLREQINVNYFAYTGEWNVTGHRRVPSNNILANMTYGTGRMNAYRIIEDTLNLKDVRVYDTIHEDGKDKRVLNKKETTLAQQKQEAIKQAFGDWVWSDPDRRRDLVQTYNDLFNSTRPREYDGSHLSFAGISPEITLRSHQLNAIAHIIYGGNTLLAHEVGAGKTYEMVAAAMESKRLGLCQKSMLAVPNHLTEQMASEFLRLYPSANILVSTAKDFEMKNRKKFCAKIATGDYDAVIIGHSQLERIPLSKERQERLLQEQIWEITDGIDELQRSNGERFSIKQLQKTKKSLEARMERLTDDSRKDDVVTFEQLGVDRLFVDEAHNFKNLFLYTKMRNVAGISQTEAQKSSDLFGKCRYLDELTGGKGVIFATGTPISNSMTEMYTMQRYLQYDTLQQMNLTHFDCWASTFGETTTAIELAPEGTGYRARTRFAKFHNLPELMCMFKEVADIKTADMLDLPSPKANYNTVVVKPSVLQQNMVAELSERAALVHGGSVDPSTDNMLKITSDGRKIGLDQRLMNPMLPDDEGSKVNACMESVYGIWENTKADRLAQLVFCDFSTPNKDGRFNVYADIREKLLAKGIPENEIAFIHDANTEVRKKELFAKVRSGKVRVLMGSTFKMGSGTNVQDRLIHLHDLDCPWRPSDLEQRAGRIVRQGNLNPEVGITRYVTEGTFDAYLYQTIENKQKFISQIMSSKSPVRACEDVDETALSYAEIKALCAGNPLIKEKMDLDIEVARLRLLKSDHKSQLYRLEDDLLTNFPKGIERSKEYIAGFKQDMSVIESAIKANRDGFSPMVIAGIAHTDKEKAGTALLEACKEIRGTDPIKIGTYRGLDIHLSFDSFHKKFNVALKGAMSYGTDLGTDVFGNITRLNNAIADLPERLVSVEKQLDNFYQQVENAKIEKDKPFPFEGELEEKSTRLALLDSQLNMDNDQEQLTDTHAAKETSISAKKKPSILESLKVNVSASKVAPENTKDKEVSL